MARVIEIDELVTVGALAEVLQLPATRLITELFKNGVMATINEKIDFETAQIIVGELDLDVELQRKAQENTKTDARREKKKNLSAQAQSRPPVVAVMGHVDHGKTSLLDAIRGAEVVKSEAGGITQHISAFQVEHNGRTLTLLDTPGHEAFAALREHGAQLTDLVIIVIAADDGIKPQTLEAIRFAQKAGVKLIIAANKMDKEGADINRVKQQLAENKLMVEEWGGDTIVVPVSAKTKEGINELLDMTLLVADVEELKAETAGAAEGLIIESHMEQGRGAVAIGLIDHGMLRPGMFVKVGGTYGKIRNLEGTDGKALKAAGPSTPVVMTGFKTLPEFGDEFVVMHSEKEARAAALESAQQRQSGANNSGMNSSELLRMINRSHEVSEFNIIVKADVQGSLTSVVDSLKSLDSEEVSVKVVSSGVGVLTENDVHLAMTTGAVIYGFHVSLPQNIKRLALRDKISIRLYTVIYELIDDVKLELEALLSPEVVETEIGELEVKGVFKTTKSEVIFGGEVKKGKMTMPALGRITRKKETIATDLVMKSLKRGPQEAKEVFVGDLCGVSFDTNGRVDVQEGDTLVLYTREEKKRTL